MASEQAVRTVVKRGSYHDSVVLMLVTRELSGHEGVVDASVVMGNEMNLALLRQNGLLPPDPEEIGPNDLVIAVRAENEEFAQRALDTAERLLAEQAPSQEKGESAVRPRSVRSAKRMAPKANVAIISVAGRYAVGPAWDALLEGLHVLLFSDHVGLEDELALKRHARDHGLLLMGPGAGTAILNGVGLGFANVVPRGPVGIVSAAGTGLQEVSCLIATAGEGITQGIGTGGRDVSEAVGGITMLQGMDALQQDPDTRVLVVVSKVASRTVVQRIIDQAARSDKPAVLALMGTEQVFDLPPGVHQASTLREAAALAVALARGEALAGVRERLSADEETIRARGRTLAERLGDSQRYVRGLFSGGTLCEEAMFLWQRRLGAVWSNAPIGQCRKLPDSLRSQEHTAIDMGEEEFTVGRPHPMIDNLLRVERIRQEARDPETAVILLDVVLGHGAHPDPASELGPAIAEAHDIAARGGRDLVVIASVTGTEGDPQGLTRQQQTLVEAGAIVMDSNASAALLAEAVVGGHRRQVSHGERD